MKFSDLLPLVLVGLVVCSGVAEDSAASPSDKQTLKAHRMGHPIPVSNSASKSSKSSPMLHESSSSNVSVDSSSFEDPLEPGLERQPVEAHVILTNVDMDELTVEETMFVELALHKAIQIAQDQEPDNEDEVTIGAILVENGHGPHKNDSNNRALRGRELGFFEGAKSFNIWAIIETLRCRYCREYDDDDDIDHHEEWKKNRHKYFPTLAPTPAPTPKPTWEDPYDWWARLKTRIANAGGRRHLGLSESNTSLDGILCQLLREGPHERFHSVEECALGVSKW